jgi:hypothetical protein
LTAICLFFLNPSTGPGDTPDGLAEQILKKLVGIEGKISIGFVTR